MKLFLVLLLFVLAVPAQAEPTSPKGWVLFTWQTNRGWYYSLLPGTNRTKTWAEVNLGKVTGWEMLKNRLKNISAGEELLIGTSIEIDNLPKERVLDIPPTPIRKKIRGLSKERGFKVGSMLQPAQSTISN